MKDSPSLTRRQFLGVTTTAAVTTCLPAICARADRAPTQRNFRERDGLVDTNVTLGRWPFRRLPLDDTPALAAKLRQQGVTRAWVGSFEALLHKDIASVNARLTEECRRYGRGLLVPFGTVNPTLPEWETDVQCCHEQHRMPGLRLYPNYHGYRLDEPVFTRLLQLTTARHLIVQIAVNLEDERTQHPLVRVPGVDVSPLLALVKATPHARVVLLNWFRSVKIPLVAQLANTGRVYFDIATVEGVGGVAHLLRQIPAGQVLFGSHAPLFYFESARLKLKESELPREQREAISFRNAKGLVAVT